MSNMFGPPKALAQTWEQAVEFCQNNSVKITEQYTQKGNTVIKGKVRCDFGFVHNPTVMFSSDGSHTIIASSCDCNEPNGEGSICCHCAAIAYKYNNTASRLMKNPEIHFEPKASASDNFTVYAVSNTVDRFDQRLFSGKVRDKMGFVHKASITLLHDTVISASCNCFQFCGINPLCPHCHALYNQYLKDRNSKESNIDSSENQSLNRCGKEIDWMVDYGKINEEKNQERYNSDGISAKDGNPDNKEHDDNGEANSDAKQQKRTGGAINVIFGTDVKTNSKVIWRLNDTSQLFHTNTGIIGTMGTGKTQFTKSLIAQLHAQAKHNIGGHPIGILIFDYKGDYNENDMDFVRETKAKVFKPHRLPFNPFALYRLHRKPELPLHTASAFADIITKKYKLGPKQNTSLIKCILKAYENCGITSDGTTWNRMPPTFDSVYEVYMNDEEIPKGDALYAAMFRLYQYHLLQPSAEESKSLFDLIDGVVVFDLSGYDPQIQSLIVALTLEVFYSQMVNAGPSATKDQFREMRKFICVDEADTIMAEGFPALKRIMKEGRAFGVGVILSTQYLTHFASDRENYARYIFTWVVHSVADLRRNELEFLFNKDRYSDRITELMQTVRELPCFHSLVKIGNQELRYVREKAFFELIKNGYDDLEEVQKLSEEENDIVPPESNVGNLAPDDRDFDRNDDDEDDDENEDDGEDENDDDSGDIIRHSVEEFSYRFANSRSDLYPLTTSPTIPLERFKYMFGDTARAQVLYDRYSRWGGTCYGFSATSMLFYQSDSGIKVTDFNPLAKTPYDLRQNDVNRGINLNIVFFIEAMFLSQFDTRLAEEAYNNSTRKLGTNEALLKLCDGIKQFAKGEAAPYELGIIGGRHGHSLLPYGIDEVDEKTTRILLYDCNYPMQERYITLNKDENGEYYDWSYDMTFNKDNYGMIDFNTYETFKLVWQTRPGKENHKMLSVDQQIVVRDKSGNEVMRVGKDSVEAYDDRVIITYPRMMNDDAPPMILLPDDMYEIVNEDESSELLTFSLTDRERGITVKTDAFSVAVDVSDERMVCSAEIREENKNYSVKLISTGTDDVENAVFEGNTEKAGIRVAQIAHKLYSEKRTNENSQTLFVNGNIADEEILHTFPSYEPKDEPKGMPGDEPKDDPEGTSSGCMNCEALNKT